MITLIHGENNLAARQRFTQLISGYKEKGYEIKRIDPNLELTAQLTDNSLFSNKILFVLENPKKLATKLENNQELLILCDKTAGVTITKLLSKDTKIEKFDLPKKLFSFLETIYPKNAKNVLSGLHELVQTEALELVFFMICRQFRDLYWVLENETSMGLPGWRAGKLKSQASRFTKEKIKKIISDLADIDYKAKTGGVNLATSLDLLIARELQ